MKCFAVWAEDKSSNLFFRNKTILQFGNSWDILANFILLNPGSALPINYYSQNPVLKTKSLPFNFQSDDSIFYEFSTDPLMKSLIKLFSSNNDGGVLIIYNLFNLKNQKSHLALEQYEINKNHPLMHSDLKEVNFVNAPSIIATGKAYHYYSGLTEELKKYIALINEKQLFALKPVGYKTYSIIKSAPDKNGLVESYHPSYTLKYGNRTLSFNHNN